MDINNLTIGQARELASLFGNSQPAKAIVPPSLKIAILQRGWICIGIYSQSGSECFLEQAKVIRVWGTTAGIGELALNGPTSKTVLDDAGLVRFHELNAVAVIDCDAEKWRSYYGA